ncbi:MAG: hypothetical protein IPF82_05775 [Blastocatellia bacterium]|nr:hypothetical protein [Blastocatellia bacterium]
MAIRERRRRPEGRPGGLGISRIGAYRVASKATNAVEVGTSAVASRSGGLARVARSAVAEERALPGVQEEPQPISTPSSSVGAMQQEDGPVPRSGQQHALPGTTDEAARTVRKRMAAAIRTAA